jgi:iron(III) transport system ATP-binding protein
MVKVMVKEITKKFGEVLAVDNVSFEAADCFLTLLGPSGCGKTTILRCIAGLEKVDAGSIFFDDFEVSSVKVHVPPEKRNVGMCFQSYALWPHMTVFDNIAYPLKLRKMSRDEIREKVSRVLELVQLSGLERRYVAQLSGGQQQRVALARALVYDPKILLLDEPLSNLDAKLRESTRLELKEIQRKLGITTIYVTHDQVDAMILSDYIVILNSGRVQQIASPKELLEKPINVFVAGFLGFSNFIEGKIVCVDEKGKFATVETQLGRFTCYTDWELRDGERVFITIKPENIVFGEEGFKARVARSIFDGEAYTYWLSVSDMMLCAKVSPRILLQEGAEVCVQLNPEFFKIVKP